MEDSMPEVSNKRIEAGLVSIFWHIGSVDVKKIIIN
jgi:hypothetical protein